MDRHPGEGQLTQFCPHLKGQQSASAHSSSNVVASHRRWRLRYLQGESCWLGLWQNHQRPWVDPRHYRRNSQSIDSSIISGIQLGRESYYLQPEVEPAAHSYKAWSALSKAGDQPTKDEMLCWQTSPRSCWGPNGGHQGSQPTDPCTQAERSLACSSWRVRVQSSKGIDENVGPCRWTFASQIQVGTWQIHCMFWWHFLWRWSGVSSLSGRKSFYWGRYWKISPGTQRPNRFWEADWYVSR